MENDKREVLEGEVLTTSKSSNGKLLVVAGAVVAGATNVFAYTVDVASVATDIGTAGAAIAGLYVAILGFRKLFSMLRS